LADIKHRRCATLFFRGNQLQRFLPRGKSALGYLQFQIKLAQLKVTGGNIRDQG